MFPEWFLMIAAAVLVLGGTKDLVYFCQDIAYLLRKKDEKKGGKK